MSLAFLTPNSLHIPNGCPLGAIAGIHESCVCRKTGEGDKAEDPEENGGQAEVGHC